MGIHINTLNNIKLVNNNTALILIFYGAGKIKTPVKTVFAEIVNLFSFVNVTLKVKIDIWLLKNLT